MVEDTQYALNQRYRSIKKIKLPADKTAETVNQAAS